MLYPNIEGIDANYCGRRRKNCVYFCRKSKDLDLMAERTRYYCGSCGEQLKFALKAQEAGVDAIVAEGFEAGGHNGRDETTTLTLFRCCERKSQFLCLQRVVLQQAMG